MKLSIDDAAVPERTIVYISKFRMYFKIVIGGFMLACAAYIYFSGTLSAAADIGKQKFILFTAPAFALLFFYQAYKGLKDKRPQLILDSEGLQLPEKRLMQWKDISEVEVVWSRQKILNFLYRGEKVSVNFENFNVKPFELRGLIKTYRKRHLQKAGMQNEV